MGCLASFPFGWLTKKEGTEEEVQGGHLNLLQVYNFSTPYKQNFTPPDAVLSVLRGYEYVFAGRRRATEPEIEARLQILEAVEGAVHVAARSQPPMYTLIERTLPRSALAA